jgi:hypothetical protein
MKTCINKALSILVLISILLMGCYNKKACEIYCQNLTVIKERLDKKKDQQLEDVNLAILFFEEITGIYSQSNGNYVGRYSPTQVDYDKWLNWLKKNHSRLYWDEKDQKVKVKDILNQARV